MHRYELSSEQWALVAAMFPHRTHRGNVGHPFNDPRPIVNGILWVLHTGAPWRDLPERYGPCQTVFSRFNDWRKDGTWSLIVTSLLDELDDHGEIDHDLWCIDGSVVRASHAAAGAGKKTSRVASLGGPRTQVQEPPDHALGRSRGGFGTKIHLVCDRHGWILAIHATAGQVHDSKAFEATLARRLIHQPRGQKRWPARLAGDKGYSYPRIRAWCASRDIEAVIPTRSNQARDEAFDKAMYRQRNIIERVIGWHKEYRSIGTRYEKLAVNYIALWLVAMMERALKYLLPNTA